MLNNEFMDIAIQLAKESGNDMPIGAVVVKNGEIISTAHNQKEVNNDISAHAEIIALRQAAQKLNNWRLNGCDIYVTLEPCPMCLWAIIQSRIDNIYFGAYDTVLGGISTLPEIFKITKSKTKFKGGIKEEQCAQILNNYIKNLRETSNEKDQGLF